MLAYCKYHGIGVIPWGTLATGRLARPLSAGETERSKTAAAAGWGLDGSGDNEIVKRVEEIANKRGWKMSQVRFCNSAGSHRY